MPRCPDLKERSFHPIGESKTDADEDIVDTNKISKESYKINMLTHVELLDDEGDQADEGYIGTSKEDYHVNKEMDETGEEEYRVNMGGYRRDNEPVPDSYWDMIDRLGDDEDDETTEDDDE